MKIISYQEEHAEQVAELLNAGLARKLVGDRDAAYWKWKHENCPFGPSIILLAEIDGRLAGVRAFMRWKFDLDGKTLEVAKPVDSVTHPDFQRRGIFSQLTLKACDLAADQGISFLFNTPNEKSRPGYLKLGWSMKGQLPIHFKVQRPFHAASCLLKWKMRPGQVPTPESFFRSEPTSAKQLLSGSELGEVLANRRCSKDQLETSRTPEFLKWRYGQHPHIQYYAEAVYESGRLVGALFYRTNFRSGIREIMIDDLIVDRSSQGSVVPQLLRQLRKVACADYWVIQIAANSWMNAELRSMRFRQIPRKRIALTTRELHENQTIPEFAAWSLCFGDLEGL